MVSGLVHLVNRVAQKYLATVSQERLSVSQGSVATQFKSGGILHIITNLVLNIRMLGNQSPFVQDMGNSILTCF